MAKRWHAPTLNCRPCIRPTKIMQRNRLLPRGLQQCVCVFAMKNCRVALSRDRVDGGFLDYRVLKMFCFLFFFFRTSHLLDGGSTTTTTTTSSTASSKPKKRRAKTAPGTKQASKRRPTSVDSSTTALSGLIALSQASTQLGLHLDDSPPSTQHNTSNLNRSSGAGTFSRSSFTSRLWFCGFCFFRNMLKIGFFFRFSSLSHNCFFVSIQRDSLSSLFKLLFNIVFQLFAELFSR